MPDLDLYVRDASLNRVAQVTDWSKLTLALRFNGVSNWILDLPAGTAAADALLTNGGGLEVVRDGLTVLSGPRTTRRRTWNDTGDHLTVSGPDDSVWLARRLAFPEAPALTTATKAYDVRTGPAETVMRGYVADNAGPSVDTSRRVSGLTLAADLGRGTTVTGRGRFHPLIELLSRLALAGGDIGFRIVQVGDALEFQVYEPSDLTNTAIFSPEFGNLSTFDYFDEAAESNWVIVAGGGEGTTRTFVSGGDSASISRWGRIETFVDQRQTSVTAELVQARDETLSKAAAKTGLTIEPVDLPQLAYGADYGLGDRVTVVVDGTSISDVVREVRLEYGPDGETVRPTVGTPGEHDRTVVPAIFDRLAQTRRALGELERR